MKVITIGRSAENNIVVNDPKVSRIHLQIVVKESGVCSVVDLESANGTYVNGKKTTGETPLNPGDSVRIGDTIIPWQEYIKHISEPSVSKKCNRLVLYICIGVLVILLIGGGSLLLYHNAEKQKAETEQRIQNVNKARERLRQQEKEQKEAQQRKAIEKADADFRKALIEQSKKNEQLAQTRQQEAAEATKKAHKAEQDKQDAQNKAQAATTAEQKAVAERNKARTEKRTADSARNEAIEEAKLTASFYSERYVNLTSEDAHRICEYLKVKEKETDAKVFLKKLFDKSNNAYKRKIIEAIDVISAQMEQERPKNNKSGRKTETEVLADSTAMPANIEK